MAGYLCTVYPWMGKTPCSLVQKIVGGSTCPITIAGRVRSLYGWEDICEAGRSLYKAGRVRSL